MEFNSFVEEIKIAGIACYRFYTEPAIIGEEIINTGYGISPEDALRDFIKRNKNNVLANIIKEK